MAKTLVVYFSRSGTCELVARKLAARLDADLDVIRPAARYGGAGGYLRAIWDLMIGPGPAVDSDRNPADYNCVVIGGPVWAGRPSGPVTNYLQSHRGRFAGLAAFCVSGSGQRYDGVFQAIEKASGAALKARLALREHDVRTDVYGSQLPAFIANIVGQPLRVPTL